VARGDTRVRAAEDRLSKSSSSAVFQLRDGGSAGQRRLALPRRTEDVISQPDRLISAVRRKRQLAARRVTSRAALTLLATAATIFASTAVAACGAASPGNSSRSGSSGSDSNQPQPQQAGLNFARCMRSHGVSSFPDPTPSGGGFNVNVPGINPSSPAFKAAQTACQRLAPVKRPPSTPPTAQGYARLLRWARCMRTHGIPDLPDPRPNPPPPPGAPGTNRYGTLMGDGGYWVGIPVSINAHSPAFAHVSTVCGESP
jgi:hypothetical protein